MSRRWNPQQYNQLQEQLDAIVRQLSDEQYDAMMWLSEFPDEAQTELDDLLSSHTTQRVMLALPMDQRELQNELNQVHENLGTMLVGVDRENPGLFYQMGPGRNWNTILDILRTFPERELVRARQAAARVRPRAQVPVRPRAPVPVPYDALESSDEELERESPPLEPNDHVVPGHERNDGEVPEVTTFPDVPQPPPDPPAPGDLPDHEDAEVPEVTTFGGSAALQYVAAQRLLSRRMPYRSRRVGRRAPSRRPRSGRRIRRPRRYSAVATGRSLSPL